MTDGCGAPDQDRDVTGVAGGETVISGTVVFDGRPVPAAFVRLLDRSGEFTAEVRSGSAGQFRFFAAPGEWTLRALAPGGHGECPVTAVPGVTETRLEVIAG